MHGDSANSGNSSGNGKTYLKDRLGQLAETRRNNRFTLP